MSAPADRPAHPTPDRGALFARLFARHHQDLFGYIFALVPNWADADDILQETGVKLWEGFGRFRPGSSFVAWACTVAHFQVLAHRRRKRGVFAPHLLDQLAADAGAVADEADDRRDALRQCLQRLPAPRRRLVELVYADGGTAADAAAELGRPLPSVYAGLSQARRQLRDCVNDRLGQPSPADAATAAVAGAVAALTAGGGPGRLAALLGDSAAARRAYCELMHDTVGLRQWAESREQPRLKLAGGPARPRRPTAWAWRAGGAAAAAALLVGLGLLLRPGRPPEQARRPDPPPAPEAVLRADPPPVATLVAAADAEWEADPRAAGDRLPAGVPLLLRAGRVSVRLDSGAVLDIQGPAALVPAADGSVTLRRGRLTATAAAAGLTVRTPAGDLAADPQGAFALLTDAAGAEAHVLAGGLTASAAGRSRRVDPLAAVGLAAGGLSDRPFDPARFPAPGGLDAGRPVLEEYWLGVPDARLPELTPLLQLPAFKLNRPTGRRYLAGLEFRPQKAAWTEYGSRFTARLVPPAAGLYVFRVAADDTARLLLDGRAVASVPSHTPFRDWSRSPKQRSEPVWLAADTPVRVEVLYLQRSLAAHLSVGWTLPDGTDENPIPAGRLRRPE